MRRKYSDCTRDDGDCSVCSLVNYGRDCHNRPITRLEWYRRGAGLTQSQVAKQAGVTPRLIQKIEAGEYLADNVTAKNLLAIADALNIEMRELLSEA